MQDGGWGLQRLGLASLCSVTSCRRPPPHEGIRRSARGGHARQETRREVAADSYALCMLSVEREAPEGAAREMRQATRVARAWGRHLRWCGLAQPQGAELRASPPVCRGAREGRWRVSVENRKVEACLLCGPHHYTCSCDGAPHVHNACVTPTRVILFMLST